MEVSALPTVPLRRPARLVITRTRHLVSSTGLLWSWVNICRPQKNYPCRMLILICTTIHPNAQMFHKLIIHHGFFQLLWPCKMLFIPHFFHIHFLHIARSTCEGTKVMAAAVGLVLSPGHGAAMAYPWHWI